MMPLVFSHEARSAKWPYVTVCLIGVNLIVFAFEVTLGDGLNYFLMDWGLIPARVQAGVSLHNLLTLGTSVFMHGGWMHVIFNLWFLYVFGDSLEDALGHWWYLFLYLTAGFFGSIAFIATSGAAAVPAIGASGAIAGVMGASLVIWPTARLQVPGILLAWFAAQLSLTLSTLAFGGAGIVVGLPLAIVIGLGSLVWWIGKRGFLGGVFGLQDVPAWFVFGMWIGLNLWAGVGSLMDPRLGGAIGWWAHVGGFLTGALFGWIFPKTPVALTRRKALE
jgi:membrane associated rhomboid family serine protease